jgi:GPH family glycoside/pentoside/hexuronide:cation symporter
LPLILGNVLAGFFSSILWFMPTSMIADVTDLDSWSTGERREGSYFGMFFFGQQIATGVALLLVGVLVDAYAGLVPAQAFQSPTTANRIGILFGILPAACLLFATMAVFFYPVNRERVLAVQSGTGGNPWNRKDSTS